MDILEGITAARVTFVGTVTQPTGALFEVKNRRCYALSLSLGGRITYTHKGEKHVSDEGILVLHPQDSTYTLKCERGGDFIVIDFYTAEDFADEFTTYRLSRPELFMERYRALYEAHLSGSRSRVLSEFYAIINAVTGDGSLAEGHMLAPVVAYLDESYTGGDISNSHLAEIAHVSESYLRRLFLKYYSQTPRQYVISLRVSLAKRLLSENRLSVGEVSEKCGFSSVFHFCRTFKDSVGETPLAYAKKHRTSLL